ncbi:MAG TPA: DUF5335 family protein [Vicinamibacterales bacterium]
MRTIELPRETWVDGLNAFTIAHEGWIVSVDVFGPEIGAQPEIASLPLIGISADRIDHDGTIAVSVARSAAEHLTHIIHGVTHIYVEQTDDGATAALLIESVDGTRTIIQLRAMPLPGRPGTVVDPPHCEHDATA